MELRKVEPLFMLLTLLALVACAARLVPAAAQTRAQASIPEPMPAVLPTSSPTPESLSALEPPPGSVEARPPIWVLGQE